MNHTLFFVLVILGIVGGVVGDEVTSQAKMAPGFSVKTYYQQQDGGEAARFRGLKVLPYGDVLVVKADNLGNDDDDDSCVEVIQDENYDGVADEATQIIPNGFRLTHGIEYLLSDNVWGEETDGKGRILASNQGEVWGWPYNEGDDKAGEGVLLINNVNATDDGTESDDSIPGYTTRTLRLSPDQRYLFVSVGAQNNVDSDSFRARVRKFDLQSPDFYNNLPFDFTNGEVFADGLRNSVATNFDKDGILWGTDTGADGLNREDLGGDISETNPGEEFNKLGDYTGKGGDFYGYPYCWSEYDLVEGKGRGSIWAWPTTMDEYNDDWCREKSVKAEVLMQPHSTPLGLAFYRYSDHRDIDQCPGGVAFPKNQDGDAYIGLHGSINSEIPVGYKVVHVPFNIPGGSPTGEVLDLMKYEGSGAIWPANVRPVDVSFDLCGRLLVSDDAGGRILTISYREKEQEDDGLFPIWFILIGYNILLIFCCFVAVIYDLFVKQNRVGRV